jgi:hypothetical protein
MPLLLAACDRPSACASPTDLWQFLDQDGFGVFLVVVILIWAIERTLTAFARRGKPEPEDTTDD